MDCFKWVWAGQKEQVALGFKNLYKQYANFHAAETRIDPSIDQPNSCNNADDSSEDEFNNTAKSLQFSAKKRRKP